MTRTAPVTTEATTELNDLNHIVCCFESDQTLCGRYDPAPLTNEDIANCVVCLDLEYSAPEFCPCGYPCPLA